MNRHRVVIFLAVLVSVVLGLALAITALNGESVIPATADGTESSKPRLSPAPLPKTSALSAPNAESQQAPDLLDSLFTAHDGPAFVASAMKRPEEGGLYYARYILSQCKKEAELAGTGISNAEIVEARARGVALKPREPSLPGLCRNFSVSSLDKVNLDQIESKGIDENDLLFSALVALRNARAARSYIATHSALQTLLSLKNPVFLQSDGLELLRQKTGVLWFEAKAYDFDDESLLNAMHLVPCDFGLPCGSSHKMVVRHCRIMKRCYASLEELIAREGTATMTGAFGLTQFLRQRITLAIMRTDVAAFIPPKSEFEEVILRAPGEAE